MVVAARLRRINLHDAAVVHLRQLGRAHRKRMGVSIGRRSFPGYSARRGRLQLGFFQGNGMGMTFDG